MEIRIAGYLAASWLLEQEPAQWHVIVLLDTGATVTDFVTRQASSVCILHFDDVDSPRGTKRPPTIEQVKQAWAFAQGKSKLLVTCRAGQGRSAALAYVIAGQVQGTSTAIQLLDATRHSPNRLVVQLGATVVEDSSILSVYDDWRQRSSHIRLIDHFDELEQEIASLEAQGAKNKI